VGNLLPGGQSELAEQDVVRSVNGTPVESLATFREVYEAVAVGDDVSLVVSRDGAERTVTRARIDASDMIRVRKGH